MLRKMLRGKIHRATITECDLNYVGSITIDADLLRASGMQPNEAVLVLDLDNGARFETYIIPGDPGSGVIGVNGAAARLVRKGEKVIIVCFGFLEPHEVRTHQAKVVLCDAQNHIADQLHYPSSLDQVAEPTL